ncbi:hypothetical protein PG987_006890 [Apiospora arundinis]
MAQIMRDLAVANLYMGKNYEAIRQLGMAQSMIHMADDERRQAPTPGIENYAEWDFGNELELKEFNDELKGHLNKLGEVVDVIKRGGFKPAANDR